MHHQPCSLLLSLEYLYAANLCLLVYLPSECNLSPWLLDRIYWVYWLVSGSRRIQRQRDQGQHLVITSLSWIQVAIYLHSIPTALQLAGRCTSETAVHVIMLDMHGLLRFLLYSSKGQPREGLMAAARVFVWLVCVCACHMQYVCCIHSKVCYAGY